MKYTSLFQYLKIISYQLTNLRHFNMNNNQSKKNKRLEWHKLLDFDRINKAYLSNYCIYNKPVHYQKKIRTTNSQAVPLITNWNKNLPSFSFYLIKDAGKRHYFYSIVTIAPKEEKNLNYF